MGFVRTLHRWLGLLVGVQALAWMVSGTLFAWLDHREVAAEESTRRQARPVLRAGRTIVDPSALLVRRGGSPIIDVTLAPLLDRWVYRVRFENGVELRDAETGASFAIDEPLIRRLALAHYAGAGALRSVEFHREPTLEARGADAVWRIDFDDTNATSLYFSAEDGHLVAVRTDKWRWFDFFWMLHTMDYRTRDDFNNPLVVLVGTASLWLAISGAMLVFRFSRRARYRASR